ncbi:hypothetical protein RCL1_002639 [Eukaryota sp. TZLM3-RCL]
MSNRLTKVLTSVLKSESFSSKSCHDVSTALSTLSTLPCKLTLSKLNLFLCKILLLDGDNFDSVTQIFNSLINLSSCLMDSTDSLFPFFDSSFRLLSNNNLTASISIVSSLSSLHNPWIFIVLQNILVSSCNIDEFHGVISFINNFCDSSPIEFFSKFMELTSSLIKSKKPINFDSFNHFLSLIPISDSLLIPFDDNFILLENISRYTSSFFSYALIVPSCDFFIKFISNLCLNLGLKVGNNLNPEYASSSDFVSKSTSLFVTSLFNCLLYLPSSIHEEKILSIIFQFIFDLLSSNLDLGSLFIDFILTTTPSIALILFYSRFITLFVDNSTLSHLFLPSLINSLSRIISLAELDLRIKEINSSSIFFHLYEKLPNSFLQIVFNFPHLIFGPVIDAVQSKNISQVFKEIQRLCFFSDLLPVHHLFPQIFIEKLLSNCFHNCSSPEMPLISVLITGFTLIIKRFNNCSNLKFSKDDLVTWSTSLLTTISNHIPTLITFDCSKQDTELDKFPLDVVYSVFSFLTVLLDFSNNFELNDCVIANLISLVKLILSSSINQKMSPIIFQLFSDYYNCKPNTSAHSFKNLTTNHSSNQNLIDLPEPEPFCSIWDNSSSSEDELIETRSRSISSVSMYSINSSIDLIPENSEEFELYKSFVLSEEIITAEQKNKEDLQLPINFMIDSYLFELLSYFPSNIVTLIYSFVTRFSQFHLNLKSKIIKEFIHLFYFNMVKLNELSFHELINFVVLFSLDPDFFTSLMANSFDSVLIQNLTLNFQIIRVLFYLIDGPITDLPDIFLSFPEHSVIYLPQILSEWIPVTSDDVSLSWGIILQEISQKFPTSAKILDPLFYLRLLTTFQFFEFNSQNFSLFELANCNFNFVSNCFNSFLSSLFCVSADNEVIFDTKFSELLLSLIFEQSFFGKFAENFDCFDSTELFVSELSFWNRVKFVAKFCNENFLFKFCTTFIERFLIIFDYYFKNHLDSSTFQSILIEILISVFSIIDCYLSDQSLVLSLCEKFDSIFHLSHPLFSATSLPYSLLESLIYHLIKILLRLDLTKNIVQILEKISTICPNICESDCFLTLFSKFIIQITKFSDENSLSLGVSAFHLLYSTSKNNATIFQSNDVILSILTAIESWGVCIWESIDVLSGISSKSSSVVSIFDLLIAIFFHSNSPLVFSLTKAMFTLIFHSNSLNFVTLFDAFLDRFLQENSLELTFEKVDFMLNLLSSVISNSHELINYKKLDNNYSWILISCKTLVNSKFCVEFFNNIAIFLMLNENIYLSVDKHFSISILLNCFLIVSFFNSEEVINYFFSKLISFLELFSLNDFNSVLLVLARPTFLKYSSKFLNIIIVQINSFPPPKSVIYSKFLISKIKILAGFPQLIDNLFSNSDLLILFSKLLNNSSTDSDFPNICSSIFNFLKLIDFNHFVQSKFLTSVDFSFQTLKQILITVHSFLPDHLLNFVFEYFILKSVTQLSLDFNFKQCFDLLNLFFKILPASFSCTESTLTCLCHIYQSSIDSNSADAEKLRQIFAEKRFSFVLT